MRMVHLISTMNRDDCGFWHKMNLKKDAIIVNQNVQGKQETIQDNDKNIIFLSTPETGLSNSRNMLLEQVESGIGILGDDDLVYLEGYEKIIEEAHCKYPNADIIVFRFTEDLNRSTRQQFQEERTLGIMQISKVASVEVTFKIEKIKEKGLKFDSLLGLGAEFGSGEENAFLADALRSGLVIQYIPKTICYTEPVSQERAKWKNGFDKEYFVKKGACFYRIYKVLFFPLSVGFIVTKKLGVFRNVPTLRAIKWMCEGKKKYICKKKEEKYVC